MKRRNICENVKKSRILSSTPNKSKYYESSLLMSEFTSESSENRSNKEKRKYQFRKEYAAKKKKVLLNQNTDSSWRTEFEKLTSANSSPKSVSNNDNQKKLFDSSVPSTSHLQLPKKSVRFHFRINLPPITLNKKKNKFRPQHVNLEQNVGKFFNKIIRATFKFIPTVEEYYKNLYKQVKEDITKSLWETKHTSRKTDFKNPSKNKLYTTEGPSKEFKDNKRKVKNIKKGTERCTSTQNCDVYDRREEFDKEFETGGKNDGKMTYKEFVLRQKQLKNLPKC
ncbi:hypothetical protein PUN28_011488 [Cardiocondyla obscurior]|uniref:Uncharacterized protein n=1 Tax=Cardiocondyla obscurior TaxID=286306 RepID=A0AAW2FEC4_9HYME